MKSKPRSTPPRPEDDTLEGGADVDVLEAGVIDPDRGEADEGQAEADPSERSGDDAPTLDGEVVDGEVVDGGVLEGGAEEEEEEAALEPDAVLEGLDDVDLAALPVPRKRAAVAAADKDGALSLRDPLQAYMRDVQRYALLTPEQTNELAVKYVQTGDVEAARKLVTSNLRLVVKIAFDYRRAYRNILDLIQEGNIGLMQAVKKYDPYRGVKLSSYAAWWIRAYILRFILNNWRLVKLGTTQAQRKLFFNLKKEKARLSAMGIEPTHELIATRLQVTPDEVMHMDRRLAAGEASLDAPISNGDGKSTSRIELLADEAGQGADEQLAQGELNELLGGKIREFGTTLTGKEAIIWSERLMADEPKTLQELGDRFGVSRERVRQLEKRLQNKVRAYLESQVDPGALR